MSTTPRNRFSRRETQTCIKMQGPLSLACEFRNRWPTSSSVDRANLQIGLFHTEMYTRSNEPDWQRTEIVWRTSDYTRISATHFRRARWPSLVPTRYSDSRYLGAFDSSDLIPGFGPRGGSCVFLNILYRCCLISPICMRESRIGYVFALR